VKRILLIEDDTGAQLLYRNRLTDLGYEVVASSTGAMGLMEARAAAFDLFLVDIGLGSGIDGYEVCRRLKTIPEIHGVPVVLISGLVKSQEDLHRGYEAGCQSFLVKGDLMLLEDVVRAMLRIKSLQDDLALQNRLLEEQNRRLQIEKARTADLESALVDHNGRTPRDSAPVRPDGVLLVGEDGVMSWTDRGAHDLLGANLEGRHIASLAPESRLEAVVRNARSEMHEAIRFELALPGRPALGISAVVLPLVTPSDRVGPTPRVVLLYDAARRRVAHDLARVEEHAPPRREWGPLLEALRTSFHPQAFLGASAAAAGVRAELARLVEGDAPVLLSGARGTGKELAARILHFSSGRAGALVPVACGALGAVGLEHELFGHARGASPEAVTDQAGAFQKAHHGTLYLQDVERLPLQLQARVLEALDSGRVQRVGSGTSERVSARLLAGTTTDLARAVEQGTFRADLLQRLAGERIVLLPLAGRPDDVELLARHFLARFARFAQASLAPEAAAALTRHAWSENVRELQLAVREACRSARGAELQLSDLPPALVERAASPGRVAEPKAPLPHKTQPAAFHISPTDLVGASLLDAYERCALLHALRDTEGDKLAAARLVGIGKSTFYRKLKQHGLS